MAEEFTLQRVLIAHRGTMAHRLAAHFRSRGIETVMAFSAPDADASWLEEGDYDAYLNGTSVAETYLHPQRIVSAAMDAGCDAVHPGNGLLAEEPELYVRANNANLAVLGADPTVVAHAVDRRVQRKRASTLGLDLLPASDTLAADTDGLAEATAVGFPLWVRSVVGPRLAHAADAGGLGRALAAARARAGEGPLYLERDVRSAPSLSTTVLLDRQRHVYALGTSVTRATSPAGATWIEELGPDLAPERLVGAARQLLADMRWVGPATVRWARAGERAFFESVEARLVTGFDLTEAVHGIDLLAAQHDALLGRPLGWPDEVVPPTRWGLQARLLHDGADGCLDRFVLPEEAASGADEGATLSADTEPLLAKVTVVGATRDEAVAALREALATVVVEGVGSNLEGLRAAAAAL